MQLRQLGISHCLYYATVAVRCKQELLPALQNRVFGAFNASFCAFGTGRRSPGIRFEELHTHHYVSSLVKYILEFFQYIFMQHTFGIQNKRRITSIDANFLFKTILQLCAFNACKK
jgi:hypothetical protein